jgi:H+/Cl- antiporter ClcA
VTGWLIFAVALIVWLGSGLVAGRRLRRRQITDPQNAWHGSLCRATRDVRWGGGTRLKPQFCDCGARFLPYLLTASGPMALLAMAFAWSVNAGQPMSPQRERELRERVRDLERELGIT